MTEVRVPKLNNNDTSYILVEWLAADGDAVAIGDPLVVVETSKTAEELLAEDAGILRRVVAEGADCEPGQLIARLQRPGETETAEAVPAVTAATATTAASSASSASSARESGGTAGPGLGGTGDLADLGDLGDLVVTAPARALMEELGVPAERLRTLGKKVIRREDVAALAAPGPGSRAGLVALSKAQRLTGEVVRRSHETIPAAFTAVKVDVTGTAKLTRDLSRHARTLIGLSELLVKAVADQRADFPLMFATLVEPGYVRLAEASHVGVTIDVGKGLFIPVVRDADTRPLDAVARELMDHRMTALRGSFRERDLEGANIAVTLHNDGAVTVAVPIVYPGHVCALSLAATQQEVVAADDGFTVRQTVQLGLAFDHRVVNGRDAAMFLGAVKQMLETPRRWLE
ncbi:dihydrolipoamide acetyltransferase component of pyruvate dehydrogenase complex [Acrocarpospora phusangensis]|uniref:Dihydrolipoamide acetyltransferase component of pyruvate dehydrogenase complex n=1 Tax=Acrocarpospora phusangensis TaxID=1070424 RepID=A0A919QKU4_9ACTN|nr:2-oxo acid dehydrogenase subunit E2 [Acrocarpospora phusangensis]GIH28017.1 dihydrolipoamide acetyltransferase component of pyruvate dehydrogenase complex [Acrocarpospora phusangensis]